MKSGEGNLSSLRVVVAAQQALVLSALGRWARADLAAQAGRAGLGVQADLVAQADRAVQADPGVRAVPLGQDLLVRAGQVVQDALVRVVEDREQRAFSAPG